MYAVGWRDVAVPGYDMAEIGRIDVLEYEPRTVGREHTAIVSTLASSTHPGILSKRECGANSSTALVTWTSTDVVPGDRTVHGALYEPFGAGGPIQDLGGGRGLSGTATTDGPFALGNRDFAFTLRAANGGNLTLAALELAFHDGPSLFRCGPFCAVLAGVHSLNVNVDAAGNARAPIPLLFDDKAFGLAVSAQLVVFTPSTNPGGLAPVSVTNTLRAVLGNCGYGRGA